MSDRDYRQLVQMHESLNSYDPKRTDLEALASQLLNLRAILETVDRDWDHQFTQAVATLDSASQTSPEQRESLGAQFDAIVASAVSELRCLVEEALSRQPVPTDE